MLILVSGRLASGNSTLAKQLGRDLGMSCVCRDELTAYLADLLTSREAIGTLADKRRSPALRSRPSTRSSARWFSQASRCVHKSRRCCRWITLARHCRGLRAGTLAAKSWWKSGE